MEEGVGNEQPHPDDEAKQADNVHDYVLHISIKLILKKRKSTHWIIVTNLRISSLPDKKFLHNIMPYPSPIRKRRILDTPSPGFECVLK